ncbi:hypothetical protein FJZ41_00915 [Candidatus Shapirobacteria bacterium]|nr:hypothetical protein [Candidatus Shapirobacteria bacterium]
MAKSLLKINARQLRSKGESVKEIAKKMKVAKSTVSLWVRDIILLPEQLEKLQKRALKGAELGRLKGALKQKEARLKIIEENKKLGIKIISKLSKRELLIAGIALYWAEGAKKSRDVDFCNSDSQLINFFIKWLKECFHIKSEDLALHVGINEIHKERDDIVKKYWSEATQIPLSQFRKTSFKKTNNKKVYENFDDHYGTLVVKVLKGGRFYYKIMGLIEGLSQTGRRSASRDVS